MCILSLVLTAAQLAVMLVSVYFVERALKARFDENGQPRA